MRIHGVSPQCFPVQIYARGKPKSRLMREGSDGVRFDFSQRESEGIKGLKSAARAREAITCVRFRRLFFGYFLWTSKESNKSKEE